MRCGLVQSYLSRGGLVAALVLGISVAASLSVGAAADVANPEDAGEFQGVMLNVEVDQPFVYDSATSLYSATSKLHAVAGLYGFNLTMKAATSALAGQTDSARQVDSVSANGKLGSNQWGYMLNPTRLTHNSRFGVVPASQAAGIIDTASKKSAATCASPARCDIAILYAAKLTPEASRADVYQTTVTYTVTSKPAPKFLGWQRRRAHMQGSAVCRSGDINSSCLVDLDDNMVPIKYTGTHDHAEWTTIARPEDALNKGNWYDYGQKHWANAVTIKPDKLAKYQGKATTLDEADVLGYYTYVPRYAYEVMRRDGTDGVVTAENFDIIFENNQTPKKHPAKCTTGANHDYRTECNLDRNYPTTTRTLNSTTWSTHPAFTFGTKELNGIWVGKFETTGTPTDPTILPNHRHLSGEDPTTRNLGLMYATATRLGVEDPANHYGNQSDVLIPQNSHHLSSLSSRMLTNNDWGAIAYLSASRYGAGHDGVQMNKQIQPSTLDGHDSNGTTGCGPGLPEDKDIVYYDGKGFGTQSACSVSNLERSYNGKLGMLASTTNNPTGIYDLVGGGWEYVSAAYTADNTSSQITDYFTNTPRRPYANLYYNTDKNSFNACTYESCGGQALYEVNNGKSGDYNSQWGNQSADFVSYVSPWFMRGGHADWSYFGVFYSGDYNGNANEYGALRVVLAPAK